MAGVNSILSNAAIQGAYESSQRLKSAPESNAPQDPQRFSDLVSAAVSEGSESVRKADKAALAGLKGEIGTQQVVEATLELETSVRVAVAVRDKVVQAYQEILRMPI